MFNIVKKSREKYNEDSNHGNIEPLQFSVPLNQLEYARHAKDINSATYLKSPDGTVYPNRISNFGTRYLHDAVYTTHSGISSIDDPNSRVKLAKADDSFIIIKGEFFKINQ